MLNRTFAGFQGLLVSGNEAVYCRKNHKNQSLDCSKGGAGREHLSMLFRIFAVYIKLDDSHLIFRINLMNKPDVKQQEVNYGSSPFGKASPYISAAAFVFVVLFVVFLDGIARALNLDYVDIQAITLCSAFAGAFIGFTATWDIDPKGKSLGRTFSILNLVVFLAYGALFLAFEYGRK